MADSPPVFNNALASPQFQGPTEGIGGVSNALGVNPYANMQAAMAKMNLTPEEQALYLHHLRNLQMGGVLNPDGSRSTLFQSSGGSPVGAPGQTYNVPSIYGTAKLPINQAWDLAEKIGIQNFPSYGSDFAAENRYQQMHNYMEQDTPNFLVRGRR